MMKRIGQCKNCGSDNHPKGNIFTLVDTLVFISENIKNYDVPKTEKVKVCNNCGYPHAFKHRTSKKQKQKEERLNWLLS